MEKIPILGFAGYSGSGKTTLIEKLIPRLLAQGIRTAVIKHDAHGLTFGDEGKDSRRFYNAGANLSLVNGPDQTAIFLHRSLPLEEAVSYIRDVDLILVEGYKHGTFPQIGICRSQTKKGFTSDLTRFEAVAADVLPHPCPVPAFFLDDTDGIADFILQQFLPAARTE